jgi:hypothetical protein
LFTRVGGGGAESASGASKRRLEGVPTTLQLASDGHLTPGKQRRTLEKKARRQLRAEGLWDEVRERERETGAGGLTREVETPLPSNSPHDHMILRVELVGSHGRWKRPCLQTAHMSI